jgi:hypothetical protein
MQDIHTTSNGRTKYGCDETIRRPDGGRCVSGGRAEARCGGRYFGGDCGLLVLHRAASAVQPWGKRRVDRQFDSARAVSADFAFLSFGYWLVWRARRTVCAEGASCSRPLPDKVVTIALITATLLVAAALAFDFLAPLILT